MDERIRGGEGAGEQVEIMGRVVYPWEQAGTGELGPGQVQVLALESGSRTGECGRALRFQWPWPRFKQPDDEKRGIDADRLHRVMMQEKTQRDSWYSRKSINDLLTLTRRRHTR